MIGVRGPIPLISWSPEDFGVVELSLVGDDVRVRARGRDEVAVPDELGLERRAVDAVFRALPVVVFEGYSRPLVTVRDYLALVERSTYRGDRVRP